ncbi:hypothetical protein FA13DRAFT_1794336 [Coprinellus micaceus]|uniref:Uncharacterized protein n=1 Tax=Coprinellus micaceus TaxID=71717 RepID=A0A4Y7T1S1_COPMI|nr:hypothetical protein FA13DRAFT_1794336 [Coprinellus micaceus]
MRVFSKTLCVLVLAVIQGGLEIVGVQAQTHINISGVCTLRDRLNEGSCGGSESKREITLPSNVERRAGDFTGKPSACTCNAPFFNIWSACELFERRSSTLPVLKDWKANCTSAHVAFRNDVGGNLLGDIQVPKWAQTKTLADDTLFDVAGIVIATAKRPWSLLQIIAPLASALATLLFLSVVYITCARPGSTFTLFHRPHRLHFPGTASRVRSEEPKNDWVIDNDKERVDELTPFPATLHRALSDSFDSLPQPVAFKPNRHANVHVVPLPLANGGALGGAEEGEVQLTSRWSDSEHQGPTAIPNKPKKGGKSVLPNVFKGIPNPFKAKPVRVKPVAPRAGFRLDDYDASTDSMFSTPKRVTQDEEEDRRSVGSSLMRDVDEEQQERATLISREERTQNEVFLISKNGKDFSLSSKSGTVASRSVVTSNDEVNTSIGVVSPTASSLTNSWRASGNTQIPPVPQLPPQRLPPPPKVPPPRVRPTGSYDHFPLANVQEHPIPNRERSGSGSSSSTRTLPVLVNQTTGQAARPNLLHAPLRSVYESERYPSTDSLHQRSLSQTQAVPNVQAPAQHRRGLSEDDTASFYLQPQDSQANLPWMESSMQLRTGSKDNLHLRKSDPSMLFPAPVRAAGYSVGLR